MPARVEAAIGRTVVAALLALSLPACAGAQRTESRPRSRVVTVVGSAVAPPGPRTASESWLGAEDPRALLAREALRWLTSRGDDPAPGARLAPSIDASLGALAATARAADASLALAIELERVDLSALQSLGRAEVDVRVRIVDSTGRLLAEAAHRGPTSVPLYRARQEPAAHLRDALSAALQELP